MMPSLRGTSIPLMERLVHRLLVRPDVERIFLYRQRRLEELFAVEAPEV